MSPVAEQIRRAADLIETEGHVRGYPRGENGERCMMSALADACVNGERTAAVAVVGEAVGGDDRVLATTRICHFNNTHTSDEVVAKLREIASTV